MNLSAFQRLASGGKANEPTKPARVFRLPMSCFVEGSRYRDTPIDVGVVALSEKQMAECSTIASRETWERFPEDAQDDLRDDCYGSLLMVHVASRALRQPHDASKLFFAVAPDLEVHTHLTTDGVRHVWELYGRVVADSSPLFPEASNDEVASLAGRLSAGLPASVPPDSARHIRRLLWAISDELTGYAS